ncbi:MAG: sortase [Clostridia bacterium]|nr:sortase [Clostridia bacterium]
MRKVRGIFLISLGLLLIGLSGSMWVQNVQQDVQAGQSAQILLADLEREIGYKKIVLEYDTAVVEELPTGEMPQLTLNGYDLIGTIRVPDVGIELPVLNTWNYDLLKMSACRYSGSVSEGNLILLGHNYKAHFGPLTSIDVGDTVEFVGVDGSTYAYEVAVTEILGENELERLTSTSYSLTLFTCTLSGKSRFVVRCDLRT